MHTTNTTLSFRWLFISFRFQNEGLSIEGFCLQQDSNKRVRIEETTEFFPQKCVEIIHWSVSKLPLRPLLTREGLMIITQPRPGLWVQSAFWFIEVCCWLVLSHQLCGESQTDTSLFLSQLSFSWIDGVFFSFGGGGFHPERETAIDHRHLGGEDD